jgi:hypothetical protein
MPTPKSYIFAIRTSRSKSKNCKKVCLADPDRRTTASIQQCIKIIAEIAVNSRVLARFNFRNTFELKSIEYKTRTANRVARPASKR